MTYHIRPNQANSNNFMSGREGTKIDEIIIHHAATTDFDGIGATFQDPNRVVSAHYGVGRNQNVDQYVQESDTAYHAGDWGHNLRSIGIENVDMTGAPDWQIDPATFNTLIELVRDIAVRNDLMPLVVGQNLHGHKDVSDSATACPCSLEPMLQELANAVNNGTAPMQPAPSVPDQILNIGSNFVFNQVYRVDGMAFVGGVWQVQTVALCKEGFTWDDNGIPVGPITETDANGNITGNQVLSVGAYYKIPGTFTVLNLGKYNDMWLAQINMGGWKLWVDVATVTEV